MGQLGHRRFASHCLRLGSRRPRFNAAKAQKTQREHILKRHQAISYVDANLDYWLLLIAHFYNQPWLGAFNLLESRTLLLNALIVIHLATAISARSFKYPVFKVGVFKNKYLWLAVLSSFALQLLILYTPGIQEVFNINSPDLMDWVISLTFAAIVFSVLELLKYVMSRRRRE